MDTPTTTARKMIDRYKNLAENMAYSYYTSFRFVGNLVESEYWSNVYQIIRKESYGIQQNY